MQTPCQPLPRAYLPWELLPAHISHPPFPSLECCKQQNNFAITVGPYLGGGLWLGRIVGVRLNLRLKHANRASRSSEILVHRRTCHPPSRLLEDESPGANTENAGDLRRRPACIKRDSLAHAGKVAGRRDTVPQLVHAGSGGISKLALIDALEGVRRLPYMLVGDRRINHIRADLPYRGKSRAEIGVLWIDREGTEDSAACSLELLLKVTGYELRPGVIDGNYGRGPGVESALWE